MTNTAKAYDNLTPFYHLIQDWHSAIKRQAGIISPLLPSPQEAGRVLDCACGIGTQALGLAAVGYEMEGSDISSGEIDRAQREAATLGLNPRFRVDDMMTLEAAPIGRYGALLCMDNSLPHLDGDEQILTALKAMRSREVAPENWTGS